MKSVRAQKSVKKPLIFRHLAILLTLTHLANAEPQVEDKLTINQDGNVNYEANFSLFGRPGQNRAPEPGRVLPPIKSGPPSSFTDPDVFFKSVGKPDVDTQPRRRY